MSVSGSFSAVGVSAVQALGPDQRLDVAVTGTYVANVILEFSDNAGLSWVFRKDFSAPNSTSYIERGLYRFRCLVRTSGTASYTLTPAVDVPDEALVTQGMLDAALANIGPTGLPLESNSSIAFTEGVASITAEVVPGQFGTLDGNNVWEGSVAFGGLAASTVTGTQNNFTPTDLGNSRNLRWSGASAAVITGILAQVDGFEYIVENHTALTTGPTLELQHESGSSTANNRLQLPKAASLFLLPGESVTLRYNLSAQRWRVISSSAAFSGVATSTVTTKQNDYSPTNFANARALRWSGAGSTGFTGFLAQIDGFEFVLSNRTSLTTGYLLWLEHESASSAAVNRIQLPKGMPAFLFPGDSMILRYNLTDQRWFVIGWMSQGKMMGLTEFNDFITEPASGFVSGSGASIANASASNWSSLKGHGAATVSTGTTTTGRAGLGAVGTTLAANVIPGHGAMLFLSSLIVSTAPDGTETYVAACGFSDIQDGTIDNGCYWELRWNGSAAEWSQTVVSAGTPTRTVTNSPAVSTAATAQLGVFYSGDGLRADFLQSTDGKTFILASAVTTGVPAVTGSGIMSACLGLLKSAGTTARTLLVDYIGFRVDSLRA